MDEAKELARGMTLEALERRLGVRRRAQIDAARSDAGTGPTDAERDIAAAIDAARAQLEARRRAAADQALRAARKAGGGGPGFEAIEAEAKLSLKLAEGRVAAEAVAARRRHEQAMADLEGFRRAHGLRRPASYPASALLAAALLFAAALLEALLSAALFDADLEGGLLAAAAVAGGLGGANVCLGFLAGFLGLRYLQHRDLSPRVAGGAALLAMAGLAVGLTLFAADWRDDLRARDLAAQTQAGSLKAQADLERCLAAIRDDPAAALDDGVYSAKEARCRARHAAPATLTKPPVQFWPLKLSSPEAVVLLMLGVGVWAFAALKGYSGVDDPYPDYGKLDRAARTAEDDRDAVRQDARAALEAPVAAARAATTQALAAQRGSLAEAEAAFEAAAEAIAPLDAEARRLDRLEASLVALYRAEIAKRRNDAASGAPLTRAPTPLEDPLSAAGAALSLARAAAAETDGRAGAALGRLSDEIDAAMARLDGSP